MTSERGPVGGAGELTRLIKECRETAERWRTESRDRRISRAVQKDYSTQLNALANLLECAAKAPQGMDLQIICRKLDAVAQHLNLKGRPQSLDIATAVRLVEEAAEWAAKHIEERGRELDKLRATLNKVAKDIDGTSPNGESIARERIQSVLREAAAPKPAPAAPACNASHVETEEGAGSATRYATSPSSAQEVNSRSQQKRVAVLKGEPMETKNIYTPHVNIDTNAGPAPGAERLREALDQLIIGPGRWPLCGWRRRGGGTRTWKFMTVSMGLESVFGG